MTDEKILKLLLSGNLDDSCIGLSFLMEKYPDNEDIKTFFGRHGTEFDYQEGDEKILTFYYLGSKDANNFVEVYRPSRELYFYVSTTSVWVYKEPLGYNERVEI